MNRIECTLAELSSMLITAQKNNVKGKEVSLVVASSSKTKKKKTKKNVLKAQKAIAKRKRTSENKGKCFFCEGEGHWKRNCPKYKEFKGKNKKNENPGEGMSISCSFNSNNDSSSKAWVLDTGASSHICSSLQDLANERKLDKDEVILKLGNNVSVAAKAIGSSSILLYKHVLYLNNVLYLPNAYRNIMSISCMTRLGYDFLFTKDVCKIIYDNKIVGYGYVQNGLYCINEDVSNTNNVLEINTISDQTSKQLWHLRLGHIAEDRLNKLDKMGILSNLDSASISTCESCLKGKMTRSPFVG